MSLIGKSIGNYQIKAKLGEGGMGAVYLGEHPLIGKRVAVKVLLEELASKEDIVSRFFNEAKAVNDIGHQNIVDIVDFGKMKNESGNDFVYFIMEFLDGESLAARLRRTGLKFSETLHVIEQCCSALAASHVKGIVHRDLKPENIYLCPRGTDKNFVKLLDFGIAKLTGDGGSSHKTRTGLVIGTPAYMSPEQCEGKGHIDARSDVYSLGVVMYELLTGRVPFPGEGFGEILVAHLTKQPDPPSSINPDVTPEIEAIVMHAIEKDRNRRYQTMDEFAAALKDPPAHLQAYNPLPGYQPAQSPTYAAQAPLTTGRREPTGQAPVGPTTGLGQRPTTLSGAAAEMEGGVPKKSKMPLIAGAAVVLVGGAIAAVVGLKGKDQPKAPLVPATVQTAPKEEKVKLTVRSDPPGAKTFRVDTGESGVTPVTYEVKKGAPSFDVQVKADGYKSKTITLTTDHDQAKLAELEKGAAEPVAATPPTTAPPPVAEDKTAKKEHHHSSSSSATPTTTKKKKGGEEGGSDDMKLLQPQF
jgi:serine/threonine-protein kinase